MAKVTFDWVNKLIVVNNAITTLDVTIDLYSDWKEWAILSDNLKYLSAFSVIWWESIGWGKFAGNTFFVTNGWTIRPYEWSHTLTINWNIFGEWWASFIVPVLGSFTVWVQFTNSNLAQGINVAGWSGASAQELWEYNNRTLTEWSWLDETQFHEALDSYANKDWYKAVWFATKNPPSQNLDDYKADVSNLSADVNVVEVWGNPVTSPDDFKQDYYDDQAAQIKLNEIKAQNILIKGDTAATKTKVDTLENYDDTITQNKLDNIQSDIDIIQPLIDWIDLQLTEVLSNVAYQERVIFIDTEAVPPGDWTSKTPFSDFTLAIDFAEAEWIKKIIIFSDITADRNLKNFVFIWVWTPKLNCNGQNLDKSEFQHLQMSGTYSWSPTVQECFLLDWFKLKWTFEKCWLIWNIEAIWNADLIGCFAKSSAGSPVNLINTQYTVEIRWFIWPINIQNCNTSTAKVTAIMNWWKVNIESSCTLWFISVWWVAGFENNANWTTVDFSTLLNQEFAERVTRGSLKIEWTVLIAYDELGEIQRWDLQDVNTDPSNENVFYRVKQ